MTHPFSTRILSTILAVCSTCFFPSGSFSGSAEQDIEIVPQAFAAGSTMSVTFSPDGHEILTGGEKSAELWSVDTGALIRTFQDGGGVFATAISPDGHRILTGSRDNTLKLWDAASGTLLRSMPGHTGLITGVAFSPDTQLAVSASEDKSVKIWNLAEGKAIHTLASDGMVIGPAFSPDGTQLLFGGRHNALNLWDVSTAKLLRTFRTPIAKTKSSMGTFSPNGNQIAMTTDFGTWLFESKTGRVLLKQKIGLGSFAPAVLSPDGTRILMGGDGPSLVLKDIATGKDIQTFTSKQPKAFARFMAFSPDGRHIASASTQLHMLDDPGGDSTLEEFDVKTGTLLRSFKSRLNPLSSATFSPDGQRILTRGGDGTLRLWDASRGALIRTFQGTVSNAAFSADGRYIASGYHTSVNVWDAINGFLLKAFSTSDKQFAPKDDATDGDRTKNDDEEEAPWIIDLGFSPDGNSISTLFNDDSIKLWDAATGTPLETPKTSAFLPGDIQERATTQDGLRMAKAEGGLVETPQIEIADVQAGKTTVTIGSTSDVRSVTFSPKDDRILAGSEDGSVKLFDASSGALLREFKGHALGVRTVAFSPDSRHLLSGSNDNTTKLWDASTGVLLHTFNDHKGPVTSVAFSPDGSRILSASYDGTIAVREANTGQLLSTLVNGMDKDWLAITPNGFFEGTRDGENSLAIVDGLKVTAISQIEQSLYGPDLVRAALAGDPEHDVERASQFNNLRTVLASGPAPKIEITTPEQHTRSQSDVVTVEADIVDRGSGIGRIEWRVNGITVAVRNAPKDISSLYRASQDVALDPGNNAIEVVAYNKRNLLASIPAVTTVLFTGNVERVKPKLYVLAIGIDNYIDHGWSAPNGRTTKFPPLHLAVKDALSLAEAFQRAGKNLYSTVQAVTLLNERATAANLDATVNSIASEISPRDTFVFFAAGHGYSSQGHFYLIPQDYQGGINPLALTERAIGQAQLQDWIANRIKAKKAIILLDTCESGALTNGYERSRINDPASEASVGRLHEATGRPVLTASAANQFAHEGVIGAENESHGVFTWAVLDALRNGDTDGDGLIELSELVAHVQAVVPSIASGLARTVVDTAPVWGQQTPRFGSPSEDFSLVERLR